VLETVAYLVMRQAETRRRERPFVVRHCGHIVQAIPSKGLVKQPQQL
jgi:hypothetical protein